MDGTLPPAAPGLMVTALREARPRGHGLAVAGAVGVGVLDFLALHGSGYVLYSVVDGGCAALLAAAGVTAQRHDPGSGVGGPLLVMAAVWVLGALPVVSFAAAVVFWVALGWGLWRTLRSRRSLAFDQREVLLMLVLATVAAVTAVVTAVRSPGGSFRPPGPAQLPAVVLVAVIPLVVLLVAARRRMATIHALASLSRGAAASTLESVQTMLGEALGDPGLIVGFPGLNSPARAPEWGPPVAITSDVGEEIAQVHLSPGFGRRPALVQTVLLAARPALENARLLAANQEQLRLLRETRKLVAFTALQERQRIERDLHDGAQQRLLTLSMRLEIARLQIEDPVLRESIERVRDELRTAHRELREVASTVFPAVLDTAGLAAALDVLAERLPMVLLVRLGPERFDPTAETAAYFAAHDLLVDIARAGQAESKSVTATVNGGRRGDVLWLHIHVEADRDPGATVAPSPVVALVADRLHALDATITDTRHDSGGGSVIEMEIPCE